MIMMNCVRSSNILLRNLSRIGIVRCACVHDGLDQTNVVTESLLEEFRSVGFSTEDGSKILSKHPQLLSETIHGKISDCYFRLLTIMPKNKARIIFLKSPEIILRDADDVFEINDYLVNKMGIENQKMTDSRVFTHSLDHVKTRHEFLYRAGLYELPSYHGETKTVENPSLRRIVDSSDGQFCKMTGISVEEYRAFRNLISLEQEEMDEDVIDEGDYRYSEEGEQLTLERKLAKMTSQSSTTRKRRR